MVAGGSRSTRSVLATFLALSWILVVVACGSEDSDDRGGASRDASENPSVTISAAGERGRVLARDKGCTACHSIDGERSTGPTWEGLAGSEVKLDDGTTLIADDAYLARSIIDPGVQVVDGFADIMPAAYDALSDEDVADLLAYLHDLS